MKIAYLVNRYPAASHSFIRREIAGVESAGVTVSRFSIRPPAADLPDAVDRREAELTTVILDSGLKGLLFATIGMFIQRPHGMWRALRIAVAAVIASGSWKQLMYFAEAAWLARKIGGIDHVHAHFGTNPAQVARLVHHIADVPYSFTAHGPDEFDSPVALDLAGKVEDARLANGVSSFGRSQLMRWSNPHYWHKIIVLRCGVDSLFIDDVPHVDRQAAILCCVARLSAQKGLPLLIEAAAELKSRGRDFRLILAGDGDLRSDLERMILNLGLDTLVTITGYVDAGRVREIMLSARAMVLPSFAEGLPVVVMEALALRTPVIVTAVAGTPELVDASCGWLITAGSVEALVNAMEAALDSTTSDLHAKGEIGRSRVLAQHDSARNGREFVERLREAA